MPDVDQDTPVEIVSQDARIIFEVLANGDDGLWTFGRPFAVALLEEARIILDQEGGCDHEVGICACDFIAAIRSLDMAVRGMTACLACGGDGCPECGGSGEVRL